MFSSPELRPVNRRVNRYEQTEIDALIFYGDAQTGRQRGQHDSAHDAGFGRDPFNELCVTDYLMIRAYMWKTPANAS